MERTWGLRTVGRDRRGGRARRSSPSRLLVAAALGAMGALGLAAPASAESLLETTVSATGTLGQSCFERELSGGEGVDANTLTAPALGVIEARLEGPSSSDWDVAVLDASEGATVAASAYRGSTEVAQGFVFPDEPLVVQACRRSGDASSAELTVDFSPTGDVEPQRASLVKVVTPTQGDKRELQKLGLDLTEHGGEEFVEVVTYGQDDRETLEENGFRYVVETPNLAAQSEEDREADAQFAQAVSRSGLPSGRTTYRRLFHYSEQMKRLAERHPDLVKPITLPFQTYEGRQVEGIEITTNPRARDGKPVFLNMGLHHAREWPSGEHSLEWAYELIRGYRRGNDRVVDLVESTRTVIVPVVNPDGFNISREVGEVLGGGDGRDADSYEELLAQLVAYQWEYWRKNCRFVDDSDGGSCLQPGNGIVGPGVDPNRNYGGFWGGPGASTNPLIQSYRGPGPFSEPETENVRRLVSRRQVTTLITNHTFSNLILRPPGVAGEPDAPDEPIYRALGAKMAAENGYANQKGYELYDTTGTTEDWTYWTTGGLGYTFEIGCEARFPDSEECDYGNFHGPYEDVVAEYEGETEYAGEGGGNREAFFIAQENTARTKRHSLLRGRAPGDAVLRLKKVFRTETWKGQHGTFRDRLVTLLDVRRSGRFSWHINPSTRPVVAQERGREATGDPSPPHEFKGGVAGAEDDPANDGAAACLNYSTENPRCFNDHPFVVPAGEGIDNARAIVEIEWTSPASDWDLRVFHDSDGDGSSVGEEEVASSGEGFTTWEEASFAEPLLEPGEQYVARVINWAAVEDYEGRVTFEGPEEHKPAETESWTLTCERPQGTVVTSRQITIDRGERQRVNLSRSCKRSARTAGSGSGGNSDVKGGAGQREAR